jgi:hypothetical protein
MNVVIDRPIIKRKHLSDSKSNIIYSTPTLSKAKAVPLQAKVALGGRGTIAPTLYLGTRWE